MDKNNLSDLDKDTYNAEIDNQAEYTIQVGINLDEFETHLVPMNNNSRNSNNEKVSIEIFEGKPPALECGIFSGKERDEFAFHRFMSQFNNVIGLRKQLSNSAKQSYFYGYLQGYALSISNDSYVVALQMLKNEFLDEGYIIDETFQNILNVTPSNEYVSDFTIVQLFINEIRSYLHELKSFKIDPLEGGTAGNIFVSHLMFNKLPKVVKRELINKTSSNYPTLNDIFLNYKQVFKTLNQSTVAKPIHKDKSKPIDSSSVATLKEKYPTAQNYKIIEQPQNK